MKKEQIEQIVNVIEGQLTCIKEVIEGSDETLRPIEKALILGSFGMIQTALHSIDISYEQRTLV